MKRSLPLTALCVVVTAGGGCPSSTTTRPEPLATPSISANAERRAPPEGEANVVSSAATSGAPWLPWPAPDAAELKSGQRQASFSLAVARHLPVAEAGRAEARSFVFAPVSLAALLALSYEAARGTTRVEIGKSLGLDGESDTAGARGLARLAEFSTTDPWFRAQHASALWSASSVTPRPAFRETAGGDYHVAFLTGKPGESPASAINDWLKTAMGAPGNLLLTPDALRADARFVMTDFLSVSGAWRTPFAVERTRPLPFTGGDGKKSDLPTMTSVGTLLAASGEDFDAVELSLKSPEHHLCIVLPKPGAMATLQSSLGARLSAIRAAQRPTYAELQLPRFSVENRLTLKDALSAVGIVTAFSNTADFGGMSANPIYLDQVMQNVTFEVNERGLRGSSATVASFPPPSPPQKPVLIPINRPFLFSLLNIRTGAILFSGRYSGPDE